MANEHTHQGPPKANFPRPQGTPEQPPPAPQVPRKEVVSLWSYLRLFSRQVHTTANEHTHQGPPKSNFPRT